MSLRIKVLIVDKDKDIRKSIRDFLEESFFVHIVEADDGVHADLKLRNELFHLLITELDVPRFPGVKLITSLFHPARSFQRPENIVILSNAINKQTVDEINIRSKKVKAFSKPFRSEALLEHLERLGFPIKEKV
jgi:DNA-binding response OmpR family regulator